MLEVLLSVIVYDERQLTVSDTLNRLDTTYSHAHSGGEEENGFSPLEELLSGTRKAQERQQVGSTDGYMIGGSEGNFKHVAKNDHNSAAGPRSSEGENKGGYIRPTCCRKRC